MSLLNKIKEFKNVFNNKKMIIISEKPNVALDYAKAMNCNIRGDGYYEGKQYVITWSIGHLCTLYEPEDYNDDYKKWSLDHLPIIPNGFWVKLRNGKQQRKQFDVIKSLIEREDIESVCIGTDPEKEGELIGRYLLMAANNKKPVYRLWVNNSLVERDIKEGFKSIKPAEKYEKLYHAAQARDEIDWLIGYNFSRLFSLKEKKQYSVGRVKIAVLSLICNREEEIHNFKSEKFFQVYSEFSLGYKGTWIKDGSTRIKSETDAAKIKNDVENCDGKVINAKEELKIQEPPLLYNLNDVQRVLNRKYGYTADEVYGIMQRLYEEYKMITYPRTDSKYIKKSMIELIPGIIECLNFDKFRQHIEKCKKLDRAIAYKRIVDDSKVGEHTAIIPIADDEINKRYFELDEKTRNVFDEIVFNFLANFLNDYRYNSITILTRVKVHNFITNSLQVIDPGWKVLYKHNQNEEDSSISNIKVDDKVLCERVLIEKRKTDPPARYTDDTLLEVMENPAAAVDEKNLKKIIKQHGIGTTATRAGIIKELLDREYILRDKRYLLPSIEGMELIKAITIDKIKSPRFTAEIEEALDNILNGRSSKDEVMKWIMNFIRDSTEQVKDEIKVSSVKKKSKVYGICPWCNKGKVVAAGEKGYGCTELKNGCNFYLSNIILEVPIEESQAEKLIREGKTDILQGFQGEKGKFNARIILDKINKKTKFQYK